MLRTVFGVINGRRDLSAELKHNVDDFTSYVRLPEPIFAATELFLLAYSKESMNSFRSINAAARYFEFLPLQRMRKRSMNGKGR